MVAAIQKHLNVNKIKWKLSDTTEFDNLNVVLDNVMKERAALNIGMVPKQAEIITYEFEERMWQKGILGENYPDTLRNTVLFLLGINCYLRAVDEHYHLRRSMPNKPSQISIESDSNGVKCVVYREDTVTKTHDGGLKDMKAERKVVWVYSNNTNVIRCPVRLVQKYLSLCPRYIKKENFYLQLRQRTTPTTWYAEQVVGQQTLSKVVKKMMESAEISGYFTNHSARRTGGTQLFRAGVERKLVKEATGHRSDAVDKYQITSEEQRAILSDIIANNPKKSVTSTVSVPQVVNESHEKDGTNALEVKAKCSECAKCTCKSEVNANNVCEIVTKLIDASNKNGKSTIKIQIEICSE